MDERRLEIKVGALVIAALVGVLGLLWLMGELRLSRGEGLKVDFAHTGNVVKGAPVKLAGVQVGRVEEILLLHERRDENGAPLPVQMELAVTPEALKALRADTRITVATVGPLGEPYLELNPGSASAPVLAANATVRGTDAPRLDMIAQQLNRLLNAMSGMLDEDPQQLSGLVTNVARLARTLDTMLAENQVEVRTLATELAAASKDLRQLAQLARTSMQPGGPGARLLNDAAATAALMKAELPGLTNSAEKTLEGLSSVTGQLTPEDGQRLKVALERFTAAGVQLEQVAARADRVLARLEAGEGTGGALLSDPTLYNELRTLVTDLRKHPWKVLWKD
ncbi:MAG TPA: MlaD family protein [Myxococcaceae bacterium]|jgi:phospholipid/cholesterol/gamma-HCH transport system substrate-binding protein